MKRPVHAFIQLIQLQTSANCPNKKHVTIAMQQACQVRQQILGLVM